MIANLLLECLVDALLAQVAEERSHPGADGEAGKRHEEQQPKQQTPETAPRRTASGGGTAVRGGDVVLAVEVA